MSCDGSPAGLEWSPAPVPVPPPEPFAWVSCAMVSILYRWFHWNWHDHVESALVEVAELPDEMELCLEIDQILGGLDLGPLRLGH